MIEVGNTLKLMSSKNSCFIPDLMPFLKLFEELI